MKIWIFRLGAGQLALTLAVGLSVIAIVLVLKRVDARLPAYLVAVLAAIAAGLRPGTLVSYETTLPVGTTRGASYGWRFRRCRSTYRWCCPAWWTPASPSLPRARRCK